WVNPPAGTKSFAILMIDPEGRGGAGVNHWVAYGIAPDVTGFAEGDVSKDSDKYVGGKSTQGVGHYSGPCTPPNVQPHHYTFVLIATDFEPKELPPGLTKEEFAAKVVPQGGTSRAKGSAGIVGLFVKPNWQHCAPPWRGIDRPLREGLDRGSRQAPFPFARGSPGL